jgi:hypothetical protein
VDSVEVEKLVYWEKSPIIYWPLWESGYLCMGKKEPSEVGSKFSGEMRVREWGFEILNGNLVKDDIIRFQYTVLTPSEVKLGIYDLSGRCLFQDSWKVKESGKYIYSYELDLTSGIYFIKFRAGDYKKTKKLIKIKD